MKDGQIHNAVRDIICGLWGGIGIWFIVFLSGLINLELDLPTLFGLLFLTASVRLWWLITSNEYNRGFDRAAIDALFILVAFLSTMIIIALIAKTKEEALGYIVLFYWLCALVRLFIAIAK